MWMMVGISIHLDGEERTPMKFIITETNDILISHSGLALAGALLQGTGIQRRAKNIRLGERKRPEVSHGDELHLLEGMPAEWLKPGMQTVLCSVATPFGPLDMSVSVAADGKSAAIEVKPLAANCKNVVVHLPGGAKREIAPQQGGKITFPLAA
jgi:hypothetical protein